MGEVDPAFIQAEEHRPKLSIAESEGIPVIDLSPLLFTPDHNPSASSSLSLIITQIGDACRDWGFFQVINHGVPTDLHARTLMAAKKFFSLPPDEKKKVLRNEANPFGYYDTEHTRNVRDWKEVFDYTMFDSTAPGRQEFGKIENQWPQNPPEFRETCEEYARELGRLCYKLLGMISLSLGLSGERFHEYFKENTSFIRLNHYPPCPSPELALGVGRHKDPGAITVLSQDDVGGLDVKRRIDGKWIRVKPIPDSFIVNVGDIMQVWSNGKYESAEHRVTVNSERERFSIPFFFNPAFYTMVKPMEELINEQNPVKYREYSWREFFMSRKDSNFKKLNVENLQISDFEISV